MLRECHRILRLSGRIRISTPDLRFLVDLCRDDKSELQQRYIEWATDCFLHGVPDYGHAFVVNNFVRDWGHTFIYDETTLRKSMERASFANVRRCGLNESDDELLRDLENEARMPAGFLRLESMTLEGSR